MADLTVHSDLLDDLKHKFTTMTQRMEGVRRTLRNTDGAVVGAPHLVGDVHDFADHWGYGITQIGTHCAEAVKAINEVGKTFSETDIKLADSLGKAR